MLKGALVKLETSLKPVSGHASGFFFQSPLQIVNSDNTYRCIDGGDETQANWMRSGCFENVSLYASALKEKKSELAPDPF